MWAIGALLGALPALATLLGALPALAAPEPAAKPSPPADAAAMSRMLKGAMQPYLAGGQDGGWKLAADPQVAKGEDGAFTIVADNPVYVVVPGLSLEFAKIEARVIPEAEMYAVSLQVGGETALKTATGVVARATLGKHKLAGRWDPVREAFRVIEGGTEELRYTLSNGTLVTAENLSGRFATFGASRVDRTGRAEGTISLEGVQARSADGLHWAMIETVRLAVDLNDIENRSLLKFDYSHGLPIGRFAGVMGEMVPLKLAVVGTLNPFPYAAVLRELPAAMADVAIKNYANPGVLWQAMWQRLSAVLSATESDAVVSSVRARSIGLNVTGRGDLKFRDKGASGKLNADIRGINDRIGQLQRSDRKADPLLFPALALMTVVGDATTENGQRFHRFLIELVDGKLKVNGKDTAGLQAKPE